MLNEIGINPVPQQDFDRLMTKPTHLLLVEDNEMDIQIFRRAVRKTGLSYPLTIAHDGAEALAILRGDHRVPPLSRPSVVLLDLNMPRMNGHEFLDEVRADPALTDQVVFVLTTSDAPSDMARAYNRHIAGYMLKSLSGPSVEEVIQAIDRFAHVVQLPS